MAKITLKEVVKIVIVVVKSCCCILVLAVMVTIQQSFSAVTNTVAMVNDCRPAVNLSVETAKISSSPKHGGQQDF